MAVSKKIREQVFNKYGGRCAYCGCELQKGWHVDHLKAVVREFKYNRDKSMFVLTGKLHKPENHCIENMMPSCPSCNINKHSNTIEQFRDKIAGYLRSMNLRMVQFKMAKKYGLVEETGKPVVFYFETLPSPPNSTDKKL